MHKAYIPQSLVGKVDDREAYVLSAVRWQEANKQTKKTGFVPLKLTYLREVVGHRRAGQTLTRLLERGLLLADKNWWAGKVSRGYRVAPQYANEPVIGVPFSDPELDRRILSWERRRVENAIAGRPERRWIYENLPAMSFRSGLKEVFAAHADNMTKLNQRIQAVGRIEDAKWWFSADENTGRIFHNATTLPRDCRKLLLIDGQPAAETDIANCQPFMLAAMYDGPCAERTRYMDLCVAGGFYEHLNGLFEVPFAKRDDLKKAVYLNVMYGHHWHTKSAEFAAFARGWPILAEALIRMKLGKGGNSRLPVLMQKAEADLVIGQVVPRLMREMPNCRSLTIHDSLLLPARFAEDAAAIVRDELVKRFGVAPPVKVKVPNLRREKPNHPSTAP